jgi:hypothetical protein
MRKMSASDELVEEMGLAWYADRNERSRGFRRSCGSTREATEQLRAVV